MQKKFFNIFGKKKEKENKPSLLPPFNIVFGNRYNEMGVYHQSKNQKRIYKNTEQIFFF